MGGGGGLALALLALAAFSGCRSEFNPKPVVYSCGFEGVVYDLQSLGAADRAKFVAAAKAEIDAETLEDAADFLPLDEKSVFSFTDYGNRDSFEQKLKDAGFAVERTVCAIYRGDDNLASQLVFEEGKVFDLRNVPPMPEDTESLKSDPSRALVEACRNFFLKTGIPVGAVQEGEDDVLFEIPINGGPLDLDESPFIKKIQIFTIPCGGQKYTVMLGG